MGFVLSVLYLLICYLTPETVFGSLAVYRIELILACVIIFVSVPSLAGSVLAKTVQSVALIGLALAIFMSMLVGDSWAGGGVTAILAFLPNAFAYFLVCLHCNSRLKLRIVILMLLFVCLFVLGQGFAEMHAGLPTGAAARNADIEDPYFIGMENDANQWVYRLRGQGQINDPNDFAQLIACTLPLVFVFWKPKKPLRNCVCVLLPAGLLLWTTYLTHSRGAILALLAMFIVAMRRRIGTLPALGLAVGLFFAASAVHFAGGRDISVSAGEDRTTLWGDGLQLLKAHPIFGVGFGQMPDYFGHTAHNTIVVCAAETGLMGLYFWSLFLLSTVRDALVISSVPKTVDGEQLLPESRSHAAAMSRLIPLEADEICRFGQLLVISFAGFLVTGWFLSRAFVMTFFLLGGLTEVLYQMGLQRGLLLPRLRLARVLRYSAILTVGFVLGIYIMLRVVNLTH